MGETDLTQQEVQQLVSRMGNEYKGNRYHLLQRNCNHFASDLCKQLIGRESPQWVSPLAFPYSSSYCVACALWQPVPGLHGLPMAPHACMCGLAQSMTHACADSSREWSLRIQFFWKTACLPCPS